MPSNTPLPIVARMELKTVKQIRSQRMIRNYEGFLR